MYLQNRGSDYWLVILLCNGIWEEEMKKEEDGTIDQRYLIQFLKLLWGLNSPYLSYKEPNIHWDSFDFSIVN